MKLAVIGCGKMGGAMLRRIVKSGFMKPQDVIAADHNIDLLKNISSELMVPTTADNAEAVREADFILLSVLPQVYCAVLSQIKPSLKDSACVITIAPGFTLEKTAACLKEGTKIIRAMPNTPALIGEGMIAVCPGPNVDDDTFDKAVKILSLLGKTERIDESQINAVIGISGSSPAYVFMFIDALADAGVRGGLHRDQALCFASQAVLGSAKLMIETGSHPDVLKDMVCSPAGTTIEAVSTLEQSGFRGTVISAALSAMDKAAKMG